MCYLFLFFCFYSCDDSLLPLASAVTFSSYLLLLVVSYVLHNIREDPSSEWPIEGAIVLENVKMRYRPGLPLVLKGVTLSIGAREKIGIVGRFVRLLLL